MDQETDILCPNCEENLSDIKIDADSDTGRVPLNVLICYQCDVVYDIKTPEEVWSYKPMMEDFESAMKDEGNVG